MVLAINTVAQEATVTPDHQSGGEAFDDRSHQAMATSAKSAGPGITTPVAPNVIEILGQKRYHGVKFWAASQLPPLGAVVVALPAVPTPPAKDWNSP